MESSPPRSLVGNAGQFIHSSPDGRYEIRKAIMVNFPAVAIVNATNLSMTFNTATIPGAKFQIMRGSGPDMLRWLCTNHPNGLPVGEATASQSFQLRNCCHIIHTNAPNYRGRTRATIPLLRQQLVDCYRRCLEEAFKVGAASIAFPCLGAGLVLGWRRRDVSRVGLNTVRSWFKHPLYGAERRARIPGPIYFLADPVGPYEHQVDAWLAAFDEFWPPDEDVLIQSIEEPPKTPTMTIITSRRQHKHNSSRRGGAKRGRITRIDVRSCFYEEDRQSQEEQEQQPHWDESLDEEQDQNQNQDTQSGSLDEGQGQTQCVQPEIEAEEAKETPSKKRRIGRRELKSLQEGSSGEVGGRSRDRKPPQRYGFGKL
ncbi:hypothetical protein IFR05_006116 [Cadophora sp. M221]|nr:hypothetical protein IFR05_006116 [Cadophora sp. M221]